MYWLNINNSNIIIITFIIPNPIRICIKHVEYIHSKIDIIETIGCEFPRKREAGLHQLYLGDIKKLDPWVDKANEVFDRAMMHGYNVLVYCRNGISLSSFLIIAWLIKKRNHTYDSAMSIMKHAKLDDPYIAV